VRIIGHKPIHFAGKTWYFNVKAGDTIIGVTTVLTVKIIIIICPWKGISQESDVFGHERLKQNRTVAKIRKVRTIFSRSWLVRPDTITKSAFKSGISNMNSLQLQGDFLHNNGIDLKDHSMLFKRVI
jgi:hypothetical protein